MSDETTTARRAPERARGEIQDVQSAELDFVAGPLQLHFRAQFTPLGLLALGFVLSGIVASSSAVVWAGRRRRRLE